MDKEIFISLTEWEEAIALVDNIQLDKDMENGWIIVTYSDEVARWVPILKIEKNGQAKLEYQALFQDNGFLAVVHQLVKKLETYLVTDEEEVLFIPSYGFIRDFTDAEPIYIAVTDLKDLYIRCGKDYDLIWRVYQEKELHTQVAKEPLNIEEEEQVTETSPSLFSAYLKKLKQFF